MEVKEVNLSLYYGGVEFRFNKQRKCYLQYLAFTIMADGLITCALPHIFDSRFASLHSKREATTSTRILGKKYRTKALVIKTSA